MQEGPSTRVLGPFFLVRQGALIYRLRPIWRNGDGALRWALD
jgi:hypothetical protein